MSAPELSVIMIDLYATLGETIRALAPQGQHHQVELVVVTPDGDLERLRERYPELDRFEQIQVLTAAADASFGAVLAAGIRASHGEVVTYCEEHVIPEPGWIEARLAAHAAGATVVGGVLRNANPASALSWAGFARSFGPYAAPVAGGPSTHLPWHQSSYRRSALPSGPELEPLLENEGLLHADLLAAGHELVLESSCIAGHLNPSRWQSVWSASWAGGRLWGAGRAEHEGWSRARRATQSLLLPHTVARSLRLTLADLQRVAPARRRGALPALVGATLVHAVAEVIGIWLGAGQAARRMTDIELNRRAHLRPVDLATQS